MTTMAPLEAQSVPTDSTDDQMEQIRELLVGELMRRSDARVEALEARVRELENDLSNRIEALAARVETLGNEQTSGRRTAFDELSRGVAELAERIRQST